jgi:mRNA interferase RelE/StbE
MGSFRIEWKQSARRELRRLDRAVIARVHEAVGSLSPNPFPHGVRKLQGSVNTYRIRVGDYRVIYQVSEDRLLIEIIRVRHRKDVYR